MTDDELTKMAEEELDAACAMPFVELKKITPWGDAFEGLPKGMPALALADKVIGKLTKQPAPSELVDSSTTSDELGDLLVAIVAAAKANGLDAEGAVRSAVRRLITDAEAETGN